MRRSPKRGLFAEVFILAGLLAMVAVGPATSQEATLGDKAAAMEGIDEAPPPVSLTPAEEALAEEIESTLKCPVCRSQSVRTSRSFMATDMSLRVRQMVAEGKSKQEIQEYFVARYGDYILLSPRKQGFGWTVWLLPFALVLGGVVTIVTIARRWKERPPPAAPPPPSASTWTRRLERELEETE